MTRKPLPLRRSVHPAPPESSIGKVPRGRLVDRPAFVLELAAGKRVVDLGFVDTGRTSGKLERGTWLHLQIAEVADSLVGIDIDPGGVALARELGLVAHVADVEDPESIAALQIPPGDLVIAGELIEHLERPGPFLDAVAPLVADGGRLVVTTPNPLALTNAILGLIGREVQNAEHVGWHSWKTLETLLARHGWTTESVAFYVHPRYEAEKGAALRGRLRVAAFNAYQIALWPLLTVAPGIADGLIVVARRA
jgi:SAM-dependent methyltransferase